MSHRSSTVPKLRAVFVFDRLESRCLLSGTLINFPDFSSTANLVANGFGTSAITSGTALQLTDAKVYEARSVWYDAVVPVASFKTDFSFRINPGEQSADGFAFTIQNGPTTALGANGHNLGYTGIGNSVAAAFNIYNKGSYGSKFGLAINGQEPQTNSSLSPIDLHSGHLFHATISYNGGTMYVAVSDATVRSKVFQAAQSIDLPSILGSSTAMVGFTAATGVQVATQQVTSWDFDSSAVPGNAMEAIASPNPVTGRTTQLTMSGGSSASEEGVQYSWSVLAQPRSAQPPTFSTAGTESTTVRFYKDGTYRFRCTMSSHTIGTVFSDVSITVKQKAVSMRIDPHAQTLSHNRTVQFATQVFDQFNHSMRTQPSVEYSIQSGAGSIDPLSGLFTASDQIHGHVEIAATAGRLVGTVGLTVGD